MEMNNFIKTVKKRSNAIYESVQNALVTGDRNPKVRQLMNDLNVNTVDELWENVNDKSKNKKMKEFMEKMYSYSLSEMGIHEPMMEKKIMRTALHHTLRNAQMGMEESDFKRMQALMSVYPNEHNKSELVEQLDKAFGAPEKTYEGQGYGIYFHSMFKEAMGLKGPQVESHFHSRLKDLQQLFKEELQEQRIKSTLDHWPQTPEAEQEVASPRPRKNRM